ncbi:DUF2244 domain-containing protein [Cupriavidus sp. AU9028]|uniref:DUF2244 domain-containing protein n=1 Tax=Cupriavidus sp. AU9028 TaxID=2871157 RepID=UPI001C939403|nr:DUF2244 domain-containing protein [Cupriavidus sp. AU9028]MBY4896561.1 DUF2244 domain-containing protein [Cupriavidus sp. AU9028]
MQDLGIAFQTAHGGSDSPCDRVLPMSGHDWLMKRNCSLSPRQAVWSYLSIVSLSLAIGAGFAWLGAWFVLPFAGLEGLGLGAALLVYARHAADYERVTLCDGMLVVETCSAGQVTRQQFNPYWASVGLSQSPHALVTVRSGGRAVQVGSHLDLCARRRFAQELAQALRGPQGRGSRGQICICKTG